MKITLANKNEFQPWFSQRVYEVSVKENVVIGTDVLTVRATDEDQDTLSYVIISQEYHSDRDKKLFDMDHRTGE